MARRFSLALLLGCAALAALPGAAWGQGGYSQMTAGAAPQFKAPGSYSRASGQNNPAINFFGGNHTLRNAPPNVQQQIPQPQVVQTAATMKPHTGIQQAQASNISPYLALDQFETQEGLPNFYMYTKPQLDQQQMNQTQQVQYRRMQQQIRRASSTGVMPPSMSGGMPTTGQSVQFLNNGGYYPALRK